MNNVPPSAARSSRKRPRHFHEGADEAEEEQQEQQLQRDEIAAAQPPSARLYKHALESIFGFFDLKNLNSVLQVSRLWSSAVSSMKSIEHAMVKLPVPLFKLCSSRLARHIGTLGKKDDPIVLIQGKLTLAGLRMTGLHTLHYQLPPQLVGPPLFPSSLTHLFMKVPASASVSSTNFSISAANLLPKLAMLTLDVSRNPSSSKLASFAPLTRLRTLALMTPPNQTPLSPQQLNELRALPNLTDIQLPFLKSELRLLLRAPHQLELVQLGVETLDDEVAGLLASLPKLTSLNAHRYINFRALNLLPSLATLELNNFTLEDPLSSPEQTIQGLGRCDHLTKLSIWDNGFSAAHLAALLSCMPLVRELNIANMPELESLCFLSSQPVVSTLTSLKLAGCRHPQLRAEELCHVLSLQHLTSLTVWNCFSEHLDSFTLKQFKTPSMFMPKLQSSSITCADSVEDKLLSDKLILSRTLELSDKRQMFDN